MDHRTGARSAHSGRLPAAPRRSHGGSTRAEAGQINRFAVEAMEQPRRSMTSCISSSVTWSGGSCGPAVDEQAIELALDGRELVGICSGAGDRRGGLAAARRGRTAGPGRRADRARRWTGRRGARTARRTRPGSPRPYRERLSPCRRRCRWSSVKWEMACPIRQGTLARPAHTAHRTGRRPAGFGFVDAGTSCRR